LNRDELSAWLVNRGYAEQERGYGHVTGDDLADALLSEFFIRPLGGKS
jgi:hypothetical protein